MLYKSKLLIDYDESIEIYKPNGKSYHHTLRQEVNIFTIETQLCKVGSMLPTEQHQTAQHGLIDEEYVSKYLVRNYIYWK